MARCEYSCAYLLPIAHTRLRVHRAPGIPPPLCFQGGDYWQTSGVSRREIANVYLYLPSLRGAKRRSNPCSNKKKEWIASRSLSSGGRSRGPLARHDVPHSQAVVARESVRSKYSETPVIESISRGVLVPRFRGDANLWWRREATKGDRTTHIAGRELHPSGRADRSACLTIFWHCGAPHFSFRTNAE